MDDSQKVSKAEALYIHIEGTEYPCSDCTMWSIDRDDRCSSHRPDQIIRAFGSCGIWYFGTPAGQGSGYLTIIETGYEEHRPGFSCKRCRWFAPDRLKCARVLENSPGDDPGIIHPNACCNRWKPEKRAA